jgi:hypothetical protein
MLPAKDVSVQVRIGVALCWLLIAVELLRVVPALSRWIEGAAPAYPGQYESRLLNAVSGVSLMGALLIALSARYRTSVGRLVYWSLLGCSLLALVAQMLGGW